MRKFVITWIVVSILNTLAYLGLYSVVYTGTLSGMGFSKGVAALFGDIGTSVLSLVVAAIFVAIVVANIVFGNRGKGALVGLITTIGLLFAAFGLFGVFSLSGSFGFLGVLLFSLVVAGIAYGILVYGHIGWNTWRGWRDRRATARMSRLAATAPASPATPVPAPTPFAPTTPTTTTP